MVAAEVEEPEEASNQRGLSRKAPENPLLKTLMKLISIVPILSIISSLACASHAEAATVLTTGAKEERPAAIPWPTAPRPSLKISEYEREFDGLQLKVLAIKVLDVEFELENRSNFYVNPPGSPRYSAVFRDDAVSGVSIGLSAFKKKEFLLNLNNSNWNAYTSTIESQQPNTKIVFENSNIEQSATPYILNQKFRQVAYEQELGGGRFQKTREIFAFVDNTLLVFSASGSKQAVDSNWDSFNQLIGEMSRIQDSVE